MAGEDVYIVGGANSAGQAAIHLARYARGHPRGARRDARGGMSHYLVRQVEATPNIEVRDGTEVVDGGGDGAGSTTSSCAAGRPGTRRRSRPTASSS